MNITALLEFMCIKEFRWNVFCSINLIYHPLICVIQATLFSYNIVGLSLIVDKPHFSRMCWITDLSHMHSRLASWIAIIFEWFEEVATSVWLTDLHEIAVLPHVNRYFFWDLPLCRSERKLASAHPTNYEFEPFE
jgi:hypothetical protein